VERLFNTLSLAKYTSRQWPEDLEYIVRGFMAITSISCIHCALMYG